MIYINGEFVSIETARIHPTDRGFLLADGLFETMRVYNNSVFRLKEHWERLKKSAEYLDIPFSLSFPEIKKIINELLQRNNLSSKDASLRLTLTRGSGPRGLLPPENAKPTILITVFPLLKKSDQSIKACIVDVIRNELSSLAHIKSLNYLDNVLARIQAAKKGAAETILLNSKGLVAEASAANIFLVNHKGTVVTPPLKDGALPGITRQTVIELCQDLEIPLEESSISVKALQNAVEIFLTNSLIEIQSLAYLDDKIIVPKQDSITQKLQKAYKEMTTPIYT